MTSALSNLSATAPSPLLTVAPPARPDFTRCDAWYLRPGEFQYVLLEDCMDAFKQLPQGSDAVTWYINGFPSGLAPGQHDSLPLTVAKGTCEIVLSASGKYAQENRLQVEAVPNDLRKIALYTIQNCLGKEKLGGYSTHQFANVVDWITAPDTVFPGDLNLPASLTFFTALVWNPSYSLKGLEPGSDDEWSAVQLNYALEAAIAQAPPNSDLHRSLEERLEYIEGSEEAMGSGGGHGDSGFTWWSGPQPDRASSPTIENETSACDPISPLPGTTNCSTTPNLSDMSSA